MQEGRRDGMTQGRECGKVIPGGTPADRHRVSTQQRERLYGYCRCHMLAQPNIHAFAGPPSAGTKSSPSGSAWPKSVSNCRVNTLLVEDGTRTIHPRTRLSLRDCILTEQEKKTGLQNGGLTDFLR